MPFLHVLTATPICQHQLSLYAPLCLCTHFPVALSMSPHQCPLYHSVPKVRQVYPCPVVSSYWCVPQTPVPKLWSGVRVGTMVLNMLVWDHNTLATYWLKHLGKKSSRIINSLSLSRFNKPAFPYSAAAPSKSGFHLKNEVFMLQCKRSHSDRTFQSNFFYKQQPNFSCCLLEKNKLEETGGAA